MLKENLHYFKISQDNLEKALDDFYIFDEKNKDLKKIYKKYKGDKKYFDYH